MFLILVVKVQSLEKYAGVLLFSSGVFIHFIQNNFDHETEIVLQIQNHSMETTKFGKVSFARFVSNLLPDRKAYSRSVMHLV